ncbi:hypothetical protein C8J57DRAFT_1327903 [Mycena rebaudengoi]|nr:hypothetical protein C8J57DRAFT_1327903 [Mycena rebaudengoi]
MSRQAPTALPSQSSFAHLLDSSENQESSGVRQTASKVDPSIVYPVLTLPSEVVSEIFIRLNDDARARPSAAQAPLLLCNICSLWRTVAIRTPALWSSLELSFKFSLFGTAFLDLLELWLSRSGSHPLSLSLSYDEYTASNRRQRINQLVQVLMQHSPQWEDVELKLPWITEFHQFKGNFPLLNSLAVSHPRPPPSNCPPVTAFADATPRLARVQLAVGCGLHPVVLPWPRLRVLRCESLHVEDCVRLLLQTKQVVEVTLYLTEAPARNSDPGPFVLSSLRHLHLLREERHLDLLEHLTLPALETLSISFEHHDIPRFISFLSRSSCALQQIIFDAWRFNEGELLQCFAAMPALTELKLWRPQYFTDAFLSQLADPATLLPMLRSLELHHVYPIQFTMPALVGMLVSRRKAPIPLQNFRTVLHKASTVTDPESVLRLQVLVASGMNIHIDYH